VRIDRACQLLRSTDLPLLEVALDTGFSDQSYFTKVFRRYIGSTPGAYRERQSNGFTTE
jgi:AraC-like DNA-binding protein